MADVLVVERNGINAVPEGQRHGRPRDLFWPWAASNLSLFGVAFGVYVVGLGLGLVPAIAAGVLGYVASFVLVGLVAVAGTRSGVPTMTLGRAAFGYQGNKLPALLSYVSNVGWETVLVTLSAQGGGAILSRLAPGTFGAGGANTGALALCFVLAAGLTIVVGVYGHGLIMRVQKYLTWLFVALTIVYMGLTLPDVDLSRAAALPNGGAGVFVGGIVFAMTLLGLGWVNCGADYSRYLPRCCRARGITFWTTLGGALPPVVLLVFGALLVGGDPKLAARAAADPVAALAGTLPTWFLVPYLVTAIGGFLSGSIMDIYSSGLSMLALGIPIRRHFAVLVDGALMVAGGWYLLFVSNSFLATFQAFLAIIGVVMAAWVAVFLVDLWRFRGTGYAQRTLLPRSAGGRTVSWAGVVSLVVASAVGLGLITSSDPNIAHVVGFLLTDAAQKSWMGTAGLGVVVALLAAGLLYLVLTMLPTRDRG